MCTVKMSYQREYIINQRTGCHSVSILPLPRGYTFSYPNNPDKNKPLNLP
uniref:Uncharacterized protein n=1 Tax=Ciona intestinalis TaxID=7719 RepID=H2XMR1_CIOIN